MPCMLTLPPAAFERASRGSARSGLSRFCGLEYIID